MEVRAGMSNNGPTTYIESLGIYLPANETSSESRVAGIRSGIRVPLERLTGIKSTRRASPGEYSFDLACRAIERCLERSCYDAEDIGLLISCNICKIDFEGFVFPMEPNTATRLRKTMGFRNALAFDVNNACAGMFTAILIADSILHTTGIEAAVVVSGEYASHASDAAQLEIESLSDSRLACLTLGDSGAAVLLARSPDGKAGFQHIDLFTLGVHSSLCRSAPAKAAGKGGVMMADSIQLLKIGTLETALHFIDSIHEYGWSPEEVDHVIGHQVSKGCIDMFLREVNVRLNGSKLARKKVIDNLANRGNTATTTHFVALHDQIEADRIGSGERVVFSVTASGLTAGTALYVLDDLPSRLRSGAKQLASKAPTADHPTLQAPRTVSVAAIASTRSRQATPKNTEEIALLAAETCLANAPCPRESIDILIFVGVFKSGFLAEPSYASILAGGLFPNASSRPGGHAPLAFDVHHGPNGFLAACEILRTMVGRRGLGAGLVIAAEFEDNRLLSEYPVVGLAEVASAAVITAPGPSGMQIEDIRFFSFEEYSDRFRVDTRYVSPVHVCSQVQDDYKASLRDCIVRAVKAYLPRTGRGLEDFDRFYLPQLSSEFLYELAQDLGVSRERVVDVTVAGRDLYTSSLTCALEQVKPESDGGRGISLAVSAGGGINVACAVVSYQPGGIES